MTIEEKLVKIADNAAKAQGGGNSSFWNAMMNRKDCSYIFYNDNVDSFTPNTELVFVGNISRAFYNFNNEKNETVDMIEHLKKCGGSLNFSKATRGAYTFGSTNISALPTMDFSGIAILDALFNNSPLEKIEKIILKADGTQTFNEGTFNCKPLKYIDFEGIIGTNIWFNACVNLVAESYHSIITHWSKTASFTVTFPPYETVKSVYDAVYGTNTYDTLVAEYPNVTIVYS